MTTGFPASGTTASGTTTSGAPTSSTTGSGAPTSSTTGSGAPTSGAPASESPELAIESSGLTKRFRSGQVAVDSIDLAVPHGSVYGFLGPNGSGKTTTIRLLLGLIRPTAGAHRLLGVPMPGGAKQALPRIGALVEGPAFHPYLSGLDNLRRLDAADRTVTAATANDRIDAALDRVGLGHAATKRFRFYSLGMRQRLALAAALLRPRDLLILDEPTNGLDPQGTREVRALLVELAAGGATVVLSTHLLSEVEQICTHVGVMHLGRLVAQGSLDELRAGSDTRIEVTSRAPDKAAAALGELGLTGVESHRAGVSARLGSIDPERIAPALVAAAVPLTQVVVRTPDLEELFVGLTGEGFDVSG